MNKKWYKETFGQVTMSQDSIEKLKKLEVAPTKKHSAIHQVLRYAAVFALAFMITDAAVYAASGSGIIQRATAVINGKSYQLDLEKKTDENGEDYYVGHVADSETEKEQEEADSSGKHLFVINEITGQISAADKYFDPELHYEESWTMNQVAEYFGTDVLQAVNVFPSGYEMKYQGGDSNIVLYENNGKLVRDEVYYEFTGKGDRKLTVLAGKVGVPYDVMYQLESEEHTTIGLQNGDSVNLLVAAQNQSDTTMEYDFYVIDFEYAGVYYRVIGENMESYRLDEFIRELLED